ncbi:MAG: hypothetical protein D6675_10530 [Gemmatimonadetes bacterium]|nr:MAG: hypothetical protein D6675_10530 [Gemmatimonadota bacterium]
MVQRIFVFILCIFIALIILPSSNSTLKVTVGILSLVVLIVVASTGKPIDKWAGGLLFLLIVCLTVFILWKVLFQNGRQAIFTTAEFADYQLEYLSRVPEAKAYISIKANTRPARRRTVIWLPLWFHQYKALKQVFHKEELDRGYNILMEKKAEWTWKRGLLILISLVLLIFLNGTRYYERIRRSGSRILLLMSIFIVEFGLMLFLIGYDLMTPMRWVLFFHSLLAIGIIALGIKQMRRDTA